MAVYYNQTMYCIIVLHLLFQFEKKIFLLFLSPQLYTNEVKVLRILSWHEEKQVYL